MAVVAIDPSSGFFRSIGRCRRNISWLSQRPFVNITHRTWNMINYYLRPTEISNLLRLDPFRWYRGIASPVRAYPSICSSLRTTFAKVDRRQIISSPWSSTFFSKSWTLSLSDELSASIISSATNFIPSRKGLDLDQHPSHQHANSNIY